MNHETVTPSFVELGLPSAMLANLEKLGYQTPSPIQAEAIPSLIEGRDLIGQAQTGTGKTAAFALPLLTTLSDARYPQLLVLAPTRELAGQVAEALRQYAANGASPALITLLCGGSSYRDQLRDLKAGANVIVGTPGRVVDHVERGSLNLDQLRAVVLDEADEMLKMGFIEPIEWLLEKAPAQRQTVLFSATMPPPIRKIADRHLREPVQVEIRAKTQTAETIDQSYALLYQEDKYEALVRFIEVCPVDGAIAFVRTRQATMDLTRYANEHGIAATALNGDLPQEQRDEAVRQLKDGQLKLLVATDVAARGLDVERINYVFNVDMPFDSEAYVHRIGRTGRAGRNGHAVLFVTPRERRFLQQLERRTRQPINQIEPPTAEQLNLHRKQVMQQQVQQLLASPEALAPFAELVDTFVTEDTDWQALAAALACLWQGGKLPTEARDLNTPRPRQREFSSDRPARSNDRGDRRAPRGAPSADRGERGERRPAGAGRRESNVEMVSYRAAVGHQHGVKAGNLVGAIANEAGLNSGSIGRIKINQDHSLVDLPASMSKQVQNHLRGVRVCGQPLQLERVGGEHKRAS